jgi:hypothetical protein
MSLKHIDLESALRRLADKRIEEAMREGKFDNLAGAGKPLDLEPMPADENTRMTWWMIRILKGNDFTPEEVTLRRKIETLKGELAAAMTPQRVEVLVKTIIELVRQLNTLGTNAINIAVSGVSLERELEKLVERNLEAARRNPFARKEPPSQPVAAAPPPLPPPRPQHRPPPIPARICHTERCKTRNPAGARFCRKCGKVLPAS